MTKDELKNLMNESRLCGDAIDNFLHGDPFKSFEEAIDNVKEIKRQADKLIEIITKLKTEFVTVENLKEAISQKML